MAENAAMSLTTKIIAIAVTIIIITTVAIPVIEDIQNSQYTELQNSTSAYMMIEKQSIIEDGEEYIFTVDSENVLVNGEPVHDNVMSRRSPIALSDAFTVTLASGYFYAVAVDSDNTEHFFNNASSITLELNSDGTYSMTSGGTTYTGSFNVDPLIISTNGAWGWFAAGDASNSPVWVTKGTTIYIVQGNYGSAYGNLLSMCTYDTTDGSVTPKFAYSSASITIDSYTANVTIEDDNGPSVSLKSTYAVNYTKDGTSSTYNTRPGIIAPLAYKAITSDDESIINLFDVIIVLLILTPVMLAVRMIALRRN